MADLRTTFEQWQSEFTWQFAGAATRGDHLGEFCLPEHGLRDGIREVVEQLSVELPAVIAHDALALEQAARPHFVPPKTERKIPRWFQFEWEVQPPQLPEKAKELKRTVVTEEKDKEGKLRKVEVQESYVPQLYEHRGKRYVLVREQKHVKQARALAEQMQATVVVP
jgi:cardiolipin synthase